MNIWDAVILAVVAGAVVFAVISLHRRKKAGRCTCGCDGCPGCGGGREQSAAEKGK
ncbi:MAG: FeoB-associated Cys-rich membrane protein [Clostridia bacterium]|nr:FeoB-associated Cys-rich membrane protein [Clostridia bacterium]